MVLLSGPGGHMLNTLWSKQPQITFPRALTAFLFLILYLVLWIQTRPGPSLHALQRHPLVITPPSTPQDIPEQVWQLYMTSGKSTPTRDHAKAVEDTNIDGTLTSSWYPVDGAWKYNFVGTQAGEDFVREHFKDQPDVIEAFTSLTLPVMRSDFLRYLLLAGAGGYYADSDVQLVKPLSQWMPQEFKNKAHAVIGIEIDYGSNDSPDWRMLQFCQYTMATTKGHPIMAKMARNITDSLLERAKNGTVADLDQELHDKDVMTITGPTAFKQIVFDHLSEQVGEPVSWRNVSDLPAPKLFGDTLILPINYFGAGQRHSGSDENSTDKLVQHMWKGTWRHWNESVY